MNEHIIWDTGSGAELAIEKTKSPLGTVIQMKSGMFMNQHLIVDSDTIKCYIPEVLIKLRKKYFQQPLTKLPNANIQKSST